jgi:FtsH-binding integral membrane protein
VKRNPAAFIVLMVFAAVVGISLGFVLYFMQSGSSSFGKDPMATSVLVCALVFLIVACAFTIYYIIAKYCMEMKSRLISFSHQKKFIKAKNRKQVIPLRE